MAGKTKDMRKIKQVLSLKLQQESNRTIAKIVDIDKETVNNYVSRALKDPLGLDGLLKLDDPVLEHRLCGGHPAYVDERFEQFKELLPYFEQELRDKHVTIKLLWEEYIAEHPNGYMETQFRFHISQHIKAKKRSPYTVLSDLYEGGDKLFIDFAGDKLEWVDISTGEVHKVELFIAVLPSSDYAFGIAVPSQKSEDFIYACTQCFRTLGGVPHKLVPDNLKAAVIKSDPYEPEINKLFEDMANHYGAAVIPARPMHPKDKSLVEDAVRLAYRRVYAKMRHTVYYSQEEINTDLNVNFTEHNRKRMQNRPYSREEQFLAVDKPNLLPLPSTDYEMRMFAHVTVGTNGCVFLSKDHHYYSVPYQHIGKKAEIIFTRTLVKIYVEAECVATHQRDYNMGKYTMIDAHLASKCLAYRNRSSADYIKRGSLIHPQLGDVINGLFNSAKVPEETFYRSCDGILHLAKQADVTLVKQVCEKMLSIQNYRYKTFQMMMKMQQNLSTQEDTTDEAPPANHENIRGKEQFK